jgi:hypothetical protein
MILVHHLNNSRSQRVLWLLEELGVEYQVKRYERDANSFCWRLPSYWPYTPWENLPSSSMGR